MAGSEPHLVCGFFNGTLKKKIGLRIDSVQHGKAGRLPLGLQAEIRHTAGLCSAPLATQRTREIL